MTFDSVLKAARLPHHPKRLVDIGVRDAASRPLRHRCRPPARSSQSTVDWWCPALSKPIFTSTNPAASTAAAATRVASGRRSLKPRAPSAPSPRRTSPRARRTLDRAIENGTMHRRSHVEVDPRLGLQGFRAVRELARSYAWANGRGGEAEELRRLRACGRQRRRSFGIALPQSGGSRQRTVRAKPGVQTRAQEFQPPCSAPQ